MCGIAGVYRFKTGRPVEPAEIHAMCELVAYRGPDGHGMHVERNLGLGHRRLSIIDMGERPLQPMLSPDGQWCISFNGEIYNYLELKAELSSLGCSFYTSSDTEVLLSAWRYWGTGALERLNGMYAFAVWHKPTGTLTLVRDRVGVKPLYFTLTSEGIAFASEVKSLLTLGEITAAANDRLLDGYMGVGYCPGDETFFKGIYRLPPGQYLQVTEGGVARNTYWDLSFDRGRDLGEAHYVEKTQQLVEDAVRLQLRSDVPLGVFLSGGVDSSAVVATMHRLGAADQDVFRGLGLWARL